MLVIFSELVIEARDRAWIDGIRRAHDPQHAFVAPHFTFVFPFAGIPAEDVSAHARTVANATPSLAFRLSEVTSVADPFSSRSHVFLLPKEGADDLRALHARLYSGILAPKLHPTATFLPHVTVASFEVREDADRTATSLGSVDIRGRLEAILLANYEDGSLKELGRFSFA